MERIPDASRLVPQRRADWTSDQGKVTVRRRRFGPVRGAVLRVFGIPPHFTVHLDALGSEVWLLMDGQRSAAEIRAELERTHPGETDLAARLGVFLGAMVSRRMAELVAAPPRS